MGKVLRACPGCGDTEIVEKSEFNQDGAIVSFGVSGPCECGWEGDKFHGVVLPESSYDKLKDASDKKRVTWLVDYLKNVGETEIAKKYE